MPKQSAYQFVAAPDGASIEQMLRDEAARWEGTPHVLGGTTSSGIDCSALVQTVYQDLFTVALPRTTRLQSREGLAVNPSQVQAGDLVFYRIDAGTRHVGIYVGDDEFMHASKSEGVTISNLKDSYWQKRFWTIRRILQPAETGNAPTLSPDDQKRRKVRW